MNSYGASNRLVPISITLIIPKNICGLIIGKKGETLKDLRVKSGAQIVMSADCLPKSDERTCRLTVSGKRYKIRDITGNFRSGKQLCCRRRH